jgi:hypothetical protein
LTGPEIAHQNAPVSHPARRRGARVLFLLGWLLLAAAGCKTVPLADPRPIVAADTPAQTRAAILRALKIDERWAVVSDQPGEIVARFAQPDWSMAVSIAYANEVSLRYLGSEGIDYAISPEGVPVIHRGYNERVQRLSGWIAREIEIADVSSALPEVATPPAGEVEPE